MSRTGEEAEADSASCVDPYPWDGEWGWREGSEEERDQGIGHLPAVPSGI